MDSDGSRRGSQWSGLQSDLIRQISGQLTDLSDYVRFRAVCKRWRSAARPVDLTHQLPWLMFPCDPHRRTRPFYSLAYSKPHLLDLPEARGKLICGSSHGWLVMADIKTRSLSLLNPITRSHVQLPPTTDPLLHLLEATDPWDASSVRALLSSDPNSADDGTVMAAFFVRRKIAFCRLGSGAWNVLDTRLTSPEAVAYHEGMLYIIDGWGRSAIYDDAARPCEATPVHTMTVPVRFDDCHMMKSPEGELLLVTRERRCDNSVWKDNFQVFKLELDKLLLLKWSRVKGIGNNVVLYSGSQCLCVPAGGIGGGTPNCIYSLVPWCEKDGNYAGYEILRSEVHDMETVAVRSVDYRRMPRRCKRPSEKLKGARWIMPSLC